MSEETCAVPAPRPVDLSAFSTIDMAETGVWFHPVGPNGETLECAFLLHGQDSKEFKRMTTARMAKAIENAANKKAGGKKVEAVDEYDPVENLADAIRDWKNVAWEGKPVNYFRELAVKILKAVPLISEQIDRFIMNRKNFMKPESKN